jgi:ribonuclease HII
MNLIKEKSLFKQGFGKLAGLDEAGRGALAGPLVAAAVLLTSAKIKKMPSALKELKDSKKLNENKRGQLFDVIINYFDWSVGVVTAEEIDKLGINQANFLALRQAVDFLYHQPDYLLVDYYQEINFDYPNQGITKGDERIFSIAAASVVAKVFRDRLMIAWHELAPDYYFNLNKGYGTDLHYHQLKTVGRSAIHRRSFRLTQRFV